MLRMVVATLAGGVGAMVAVSLSFQNFREQFFPKVTIEEQLRQRLDQADQHELHKAELGRLNTVLKQERRHRQESAVKSDY